MANEWAIKPAVLVVWNPDTGQYEPADPLEPRCTAVWASSGFRVGVYHGAGDICGRPAEHNIGDLGVCEHHYKRAQAWRTDHAHRTITALDRKQRELARERAAEAKQLALDEINAREAAEAALSVVYYVQRESDDLIKIGTTRRMKTRLITLRGEHGPINLLLTHSGAHRREHDIHAIFADLRVEGEWFQPGAELLRWIKRIGRGGVDVGEAIRDETRDRARRRLQAASAARRAAG